MEILLRQRAQNPCIRIADLSKNFGREAALTCGIELADGDVVVPMDADRQHPPEAIIEMLLRWREGFDMVLAKRENREADIWLRRKTARWFYAIQNKISEVEIPKPLKLYRGNVLLTQFCPSSPPD